MLVLKSNNIYTEEGKLSGFIQIENDRIYDIVKEYNGEYVDYSDKIIIPGIIDVHNHGFGGYSMTDPATIDDVKGYAKALTSIGVTTVLPTAKEDAFEAVADCMDEKYTGARILGIHSEGPFWARGGEKTIGAVYPLPDIEETKRLIKRAKNRMKVMAIAPELPLADEVIKLLHRENIKVAACHTKGNYEQITRVNETCQYDIVTHLGNGMQGLHHRDVGALGAFLLADNVYYEIITDLNHICKEMLRIFFKLQPYDKFVLISDSNFMAGLPVGTYMRYGREMYSNEKGLILNSDGRICGSGKWVLHNMKQLVNEVGVDMYNVVRMSSLNPARYLNVDNDLGSIKIHKKADLAVIDDDFNCLYTYIDGQLVYDHNVDTKDKIFNAEAMKKKVSDECELKK